MMQIIDTKFGEAIVRKTSNYIDRIASITPETRLVILNQERDDPTVTAILHLVWNVGLSVREIPLVRWKDVNLIAGTVTVSGRTIVLPPETQEMMAKLQRKGQYVIYSRHNNDEPVARMSVNRKLRAALDEAGLRELEGKDLNNLCILWYSQTHTMEETARMSGMDLRSVQLIIRRYSGQTPSVRRQSAVRGEELSQLRTALAEEGDRLESRAVLLSWLGGLKLDEMRTLRWDDIDLRSGCWTIQGKRRDVSGELLPSLKKWRKASPEDTWVLQGAKSGKPLELANLSRQITELFVRHGLDGLNLPRLWGWTEDDAVYKERIVALGQNGRVLCEEQLVKELRLGIRNVHRVCQQLVDEGVIVPTGGQRRYRIAGYRTNRERFNDAIEKRAGETVTFHELRQELGLTESLTTYYLNRAVKQGTVRKEKAGVYYVLGRKKAPQIAVHGCKFF